MLAKKTNTNRIYTGIEEVATFDSGLEMERPADGEAGAVEDRAG